MSETVKKPSYNKKPVTKTKEEEKKHTGTNYSARARNTKVVIQEVKKRSTKEVQSKKPSATTSTKNVSTKAKTSKTTSGKAPVSKSGSSQQSIKKPASSGKKPVENKAKQSAISKEAIRPAVKKQPVRKEPVKEEIYYELPSLHINWKIVFGILGCFLVLILGYNLAVKPGIEKKKAESRSHMYKIGYLVLDEDVQVTIEAGKPLTYEDYPVELKNIPMELRPFIKGYATGCEIVIDKINIEDLGRQEVIFKTTLKDHLGQTIDIYQPSYFEVVDTSDPVVRLKEDNVVCDGTFKSIFDNVESVIDPIYGAYPYSKEHDNRTWWIDTHWMNYCKKGDYTATVYVNDNGRIFEHDFGVRINKNRKSVFS